MKITEFLFARIAEDEDLANRSVQVGDKGAALISFGTKDCPPVLIMHPARVLAECAAKRAIVEAHEYDCADWPCLTLMYLAAAYAEHQDYRAEWRVGA